MFAQDLMTTDIEVCTRDETAARAAEIMSRRNCGFIPVVRGSMDWTLEGVLTDRDLALFLGQTNRRSSEVLVGEFYRRNPRTVNEDDGLQEVKTLMEQAHIHRVPVLDREGILVGIISLKDLAKEVWRERNYNFPELTEKEIAEIVESIALSK